MSAGPDDPDTDLDGILARLRAQVAERRSAGVYPPGLEEDLEAELGRIIARRPSREPPIRVFTEELTRPPGVDPARVAAATASGIPGGAVLHQAVARVVGHQVAAILSQVQDISNMIWDDLMVLAEALTKLDRRESDNRDLWALVDSLLDRMAAFERLPPESGGAGVADILRRLERLEAAEAARTARPWFSTRLTSAGATFEAARLVEGLDGCAPVLVLGPGSAAAADLLNAAAGSAAAGSAAAAGYAAAGSAAAGYAAAGSAAAGSAAAAVSAAAGYAAAAGSGHDALACLGSTPDRSLGAVVAADLVERLAPQQLLDLVRLAVDKLRVGGYLVADATNPRCLWGRAQGFGGRPDRVLVDPSWLALCATEAGFGSVEIVWGPLPPGAGAPGGVGAEDAVRQSLFQPISYKLSARR
jgi:hypothetical protein